MDFSAFAAVESRRTQQQSARADRFDEHYQSALVHLRKFLDQRSYYPPFLQAAVQELLAAIPHQRNRVETYAWLAYAMYVLEKKKLFQDYWQIAHSLQPDFPLVQALQQAPQRPQAHAPQRSLGARRLNTHKAVTLPGATLNDETPHEPDPLDVDDSDDAYSSGDFLLVDI